MGKVLYIRANRKASEDSYCLSVGEEFIAEYKKLNTSDEIRSINLYKDFPQLIDYDVLHSWKNLAGGFSLDEAGKEKIYKINKITQDFMEHDKYVFVHPVWNFGIPPMLKAYVDNIVIAGKTFKYTPDGAKGLLKNKKALLIQASGGSYAGTEMDFANKYMTSILKFMGITEISSILIQGTTQFPDKAPAVKQESIERARQIANSF